MQPISRRVDGDGGLSLHLLEWSSEGVPLLLLHGFGNEAHIWDDFAPEIAPHYRTLALDHRGHGDSAWDAEARYELDTLVDDLECVTGTLGIERVVLVGHSLGGRVATLVGGRHPERLAGLVLVDIGPELDARGVLRIREDALAHAAPRFASVEEYARVLSLAYPAARPDTLLRMARHGLVQGADGGYRLKMDPALRASARDPGETSEQAADRERRVGEAMWAALGRIACPALVVRGAASDVLAQDVAERMVDEVLPDARLAVVPQAGHSVMTDNPDGFRDAVTGFVLTG